MSRTYGQLSLSKTLNYKMRCSRLVRKLKFLPWVVHALIKYGRPNILLVMGGGLGDHFLCTTVLHELRRRGYRGLWLMSNHKDLFLYNKDIDGVVSEDSRYISLIKKLKGHIICPIYETRIYQEDIARTKNWHIISFMCQNAGITGSIAIRPYLTLLEAEMIEGRLAHQQIAIQTSGKGARYYLANKEWYPERFQQVVDALNSKYTFVQIGSSSDQPLKDVIDLRGKTSLRQTGAILKQSIAFVGLVGGLMHLARAVDCRSVIIYGGRELPSQSGYSCNKNLAYPISCAPCWENDTCNHNRECMNRITVDSVIEAILEQTGKIGLPLPIDSDHLLPT
jgi:hypothetical protein